MTDDEMLALSRAAFALGIPEAMTDPEAERLVKSTRPYQEILLGLAVRRLGSEMYAVIEKLFTKLFTKETR